MTSNVLPLHFAPSQASSSQNSNVDTLEGYNFLDFNPQIGRTVLYIMEISVVIFQARGYKIG